ncbi:hypothetical protein E2C01_085173 [Portunus trituberculatus]|uniref:Uncharacterized protein n=1 Tax=Portunus trituberculatus TaxID=210409 RepID=A0A5B7J623_PORTR|nr:hypothetical protein [Portunus trituberculatus]
MRVARDFQPCHSEPRHLTPPPPTLPLSRNFQATDSPHNRPLSAPQFHEAPSRYPVPRGERMAFNFNILYCDGGRVRGGSARAVGGSTFMARREEGSRRRKGGRGEGRRQRHGVGPGKEEGEESVERRKIVDGDLMERN